MERKTYQLGDVVNCLDYKRVPLSSKVREDRKGIYPYYGAQGVVDYVDDFIFDGTYLLVAEDGENLRSQNEHIANLASGKYWVNNHAHILESNGKCDIRYICYYLNNLDIRGYITGSAQPKLNQDNLLSIRLLLPDLKEQTIIADVLDVLDKKIALNTLMNAELEAMAKQLYDYWFVQFDFPDENGNPYKSSGGKMVYNPTLKREIPAGWEVLTLSSVIGKDKSGDWGQDIEKGSYKLKVNCIRGADLKDSLNAPIRFINDKNVNRLLCEDDIIVEISGGSPVQATGRTLYVSKGLLNWYNNRLTCSNFCRPLVLNDTKDAPYFYYTWNLFYDNGIMFNFEGKTSGIKNLLLDMFLGTYWYFPPSNINNRFCDIIKKNLKLIDSNKTEIDNLKSLRDSLLPMLMNGQVTVE